MKVRRAAPCGLADGLRTGGANQRPAHTRILPREECRSRQGKIGVEPDAPHARKAAISEARGAAAHRLGEPGRLLSD